MYEKLRVNIAELHPALDAWMVVEGYGKVLSRPGLDLVRRELCIVAVCAVAKQDRQLQSHLHGALNVGATQGQIAGALAALDGLVDAEYLSRALAMFTKVLGRQSE
jgi:4-carboxymuconolactone decarboxylase